jgi:aspartate aminotransferase-like enzyme
VFAWLEEQGGLEAMGARNRAKAEALYAAIDGSDFYANPVHPSCRSWMNVPFTLADPALDAAFLEQAATRGLVNLGGHRSVGGMRASIYNAVGPESVDALIAFMRDVRAGTRLRTGAAAVTADDRDLAQVRRDIDAIDAQIQELIAERARCAQRVAEIKLA